MNITDPEVLERLEGATVIASVSGGKDSTAMCLRLRELGVEYQCLYLDTGWENAETYRYVRDELPGYVGPIHWARKLVDLPPHLEDIAKGFEMRLGVDYSAMVRTVLKKGMFAARTRRFCTQETKARPARDFIRDLQDEGHEVINCVGIRAEESMARSQLDEWEFSDTGKYDMDCWVWRPLIAWTEQDVIDIHHKYNVIPNRSYLKGARRVGCWPCIYAAKKEIRLIADIDPERINILRDLEEVVGQLAADRRIAKGEEVGNKPTWFHNPNPPRDPETGKVIRDAPGYDPMWGIDRVVDWSKTARGGKQYELFMPPQRDRGCMRWGLCDLVKDEETP